MNRFTVSRRELDSQNLPLMLMLAENASKYADEIRDGGGKPSTSRTTKVPWKTYVDDGRTWNYDYHFDDEPD